jgi:hypothetical protein
VTGGNQQWGEGKAPRQFELDHHQGDHQNIKNRIHTPRPSVTPDATLRIKLTTGKFTKQNVREARPTSQ